MLKSWDTNLLQSEKKSLVYFLSLYFVFAIVLIFILSFIYYNFQKGLMLQEKRLNLSILANEQALKLKKLHVNFEKQRTYPRDTRFESAIFDSDKKQIFSTVPMEEIALDEVIYLKNDYIYFIKEPESYYLGTKFLVLKTAVTPNWNDETYKIIFMYGILFFIFMMILGYFLMKLFLKPMRNSIELLDRFIKDTTHELNTPVNAIITNIEMINIDLLDEKLQKKIRRIDIGARTVSNLYQDLTYLTLSHKIISNNEALSVSEIVKERLEYFSLFAESRKIDFIVDIQEDNTLYMDRKKLAKLIDNLLSNAIKYNKIRGKIYVKLSKQYLEIQDTGRGVSKDKLKEIFQRYNRVDTTVGGFGIGLSIVMMIAKEYNLEIQMDSELNKWTKVSVKW